MLEQVQPAKKEIHRVACWCRTKQTGGTGLGEGDTTGAKDITEEIENEDQLLGAQAKDQPQDQPQVLGNSGSLALASYIPGAYCMTGLQGFNHSLMQSIWGLDCASIAGTEPDLLASSQSAVIKSPIARPCCTVKDGWQPHLPADFSVSLGPIWAAVQATNTAPFLHVYGWQPC